MFERLTGQARRVMALAQEEARLLNHNYIGTEHILLGIVHDGESIAGRAILEFTDLATVRKEVEDLVGHGGQAPPPGNIPFTPRAKTVFELALRQAMRRGHNVISPEHILDGLIRDGAGVAVQTFTRLNIDPGALRIWVLAKLDHQQAQIAADQHAVASTTYHQGLIDDSIAGAGRAIAEMQSVLWRLQQMSGRIGE